MELTKTNEKRERLADSIYKLDPFPRIEANLIYYFKTVLYTLQNFKIVWQLSAPREMYEQVS